MIPIILKMIQRVSVPVQGFNTALLRDTLPAPTAWTDDLYQSMYISTFKLPQEYAYQWLQVSTTDNDLEEWKVVRTEKHFSLQPSSTNSSSAEPHVAKPHSLT